MSYILNQIKEDLASCQRAHRLCLENPCLDCERNMEIIAEIEWFREYANGLREALEEIRDFEDPGASGGQHYIAYRALEGE